MAVSTFGNEFFIIVEDDFTFALEDGSLPTAIFDSGSAYARATITAASNASPIVITTSAAHGYISGIFVTVEGVLGNTNANGTWAIDVLSATTFSMTHSVGNAAYTSGGTVYPQNGAEGIQVAGEVMLEHDALAINNAVVPQPEVATPVVYVY